MTRRVETRKPYPVVRLTAEQSAEIADLREQGWGYTRLAHHFGVSRGAIHYQCLKHGAARPHQRPGEFPVRMVMRRDGVTARAFTPDEDARITALAMTGMSNRRIAITVGRPYTSVRMRLMTLAMHDELRAG